MAAGGAPGGAQSSRCPRRSRKHPFGVGDAGLGRAGRERGREGLLPGFPLAAAAAAAVRLPSREVSLAPGAREANSLVVPGEKLPGWRGGVGRDPERRHPAGPVWCWVLALFLGKPEERAGFA